MIKKLLMQDILERIKLNKKNEGTGFINPYNGTVFKLGSNNVIRVDGQLNLNYGKVKNKSKSECNIRMKDNSKLIVNGKFSVFYNTDLLVFENALLELQSGYINSNCFIACSKHIYIGKNATIARGVYIYDSDYHEIYKEGKIINPPEEVIIEDDVWIGAHTTILKGVHIGRGSVIAAGSLVNRNVPSHCMVAGVPAKVIKENVEWK